MNAKMGDRTGLPQLDRTNGYEDGRGYMKVKKSKLAQQNDEIREALRHRNSTMRTDLFKGISINVNGRTQPTADELKRLILLNGGDYHPYYRYQTTKFMIATNLSMARMKTLRPDDRIVKPEWITDSIQAKCVLPYQDYQLFAEEARGKNGSVLAIESDSSSNHGPSTSAVDQQLLPISETYNKSYRNTKTRSSRQNNGSQEEGKNRDIREMFSKSIKSLDKNNVNKKDCLSGSQFSTDNSSSCDDMSNRINNQQLNAKEMPRLALDESSNSRLSDVQSTDKPTTSKRKATTMNDFVIRGGPKNSTFIAPKVREIKNSPNICGLTGLDEIIGLLNEWVGCSEGITDEDTACVTKYFYDLMGEKDYHNKFYEIIYAFQQRVVQHDERSWIDLYNSLVTTLKGELQQSAEASQSLGELITLIDVPTESETDLPETTTTSQAPSGPESDPQQSHD